ncbi:uracil-DNA glycosylase family protein [Pseudochrobactrum sp. HB0163]|uniref:uracil-DNA glycosylase family protein n=1 Tax=Pseudochrobactrum sp. HB0163 TaxID=3450708 RepID=UPI003F6E0D69
MIPQSDKPDKKATLSALQQLQSRIDQCRICRDLPLNGKPLPFEPNPVCISSATAKIAICGQAPGIRVHKTGIPFNDPSGARLREWLDVTSEQFYDPSLFAIIPMGFCFPGYDKHGGDLPPRRECRLTWHDNLFALMPQIELIIAIGSHAQTYHLKRNPIYRQYLQTQCKPLNMTETVMNWRRYLESNQNAGPAILPLPHPSWRNSGWLKRTPWFETELLPALRQKVHALLLKEK